MAYIPLPQVAVSSTTAGASSDGIVIGAVNQSLLQAAIFRSPFVTSLVLKRKDTNGTIQTYTDVSANATDGTLEPWGDTAAFGVGDELWVAGAQDVCELYIEIITPGVWVGDGLEVLESLDGETFTAATNLVDGTNGFRAAAGHYKVSFNIGTRVAVAPTFGETKRKYIIVRPKNLTSKTTAPKIRLRAACSEQDIIALDRTAVYNAAMTDNTFAALPDVVTTPALMVQLCFAGPTYGLDVALWRGRQDVSDFDYEYWDGSAWKALPNMNDPSNGFEVGPTTVGASATQHAIRWGIPQSWPSVAMTIATVTGNVTATGWWVRVKPHTITSYEPARVAYVRARSRSFGAGNATGQLVPGGTYSNVTVRFGENRSTGSSVFQLTVAEMGATTTKQTATFTVPVGVTDTARTTGLKLALSAQLSVTEGQSIVLSQVSGGVFVDCQVNLH